MRAIYSGGIKAKILFTLRNYEIPKGLHSSIDSPNITDKAWIGRSQGCCEMAM